MHASGDHVLKMTPLNAAHRAAGARMVDFGGWDMPVNYGSQIEEHHAVRNDCGMFDVSHMLPVDLAGTGVREFLRYAVANNVDKLQVPGKALYTCMLNQGGGVIDDLIVYYFREDWFRAVVNAGTAEKDLAWLDVLKDSLQASLTIMPRRDLAMIAVQGPNARARVWQALPGSRATTEPLKPFNAVELADPEFGPVMICRTGYTGEDGFEVMVPAAHAVTLWNRLIAAGVRPCGLGARDTLRLEAGMNLYGQDMDDATCPLESGLAWTIDQVSPRDFVGKTALTQQPPKRQLVGLLLTDKGGVLRSHQKVHTGRGEGEITSGTFAPTVGQSIALARVPLGIAPGDAVEVEVRDKRLRARVVKPPFARNGKSLINI
ncbi:MAG: glycine cleavage system aminomethyltransferase GcvT [Burkholderiales bacterium]|nr:glycine cleavage system aminomethyltransferase GcvT [Burkholderiales bacterium]